MRYYFIAGERSGDLHTGNLVRALVKHDGQAVMRGFGGEYMQEAGVEIAVHYKEMAIMGFWEVIKNLNKISHYLHRCKVDIQRFNPDVIILVDYGGFNKRIAAWASKNGIRVFYYISPKVWAWNQNRAYKLKATVDQMFVILPFEKEFYKKFDWEVNYVGNPVLDAIKAHQTDNAFLSRHGLNPHMPVIALLPGSRKQELENIIGLMRTVAIRFKQYQFGVAVVHNLESQLYAPLQNLNNVKFIQEDTYNLLQHASAAIVTSGTATLETALFKVPQIVVYKTSRLTYWIVKLIIRVPYISLVNLIAGKEVVRELIQNDLTAENVSDELEAILYSSKRAEINSAYDEIYKTLDTGTASGTAAAMMIGYLNKSV